MEKGFFDLVAIVMMANGAFAGVAIEFRGELGGFRVESLGGGEMLGGVERTGGFFL